MRSYAISLCALMVLFAPSGCRRHTEKVESAPPPAKTKAPIDPRIPTEVVMAGMAELQADNEEVRANFRKKISGPLNDAASGNLDRKELLAKLASAVADDDPYVSIQAAMSIDRLADKKDQFVAERMLLALGDGRPYVRGNSVAVLERVGDQAAVQPLIALLTDLNAAIAANAASALGEIGDARAIEPLILLLGRVPEGRCGYDRPPVAHIVPKVPYLWMIDKETEARYREAGEDPDYATGSFSGPLVPILEQKNKTLCDYVRWHATNALRKLTGKRLGQRSDLWLMWWQQNGGRKEAQ